MRWAVRPRTNRGGYLLRAVLLQVRAATACYREKRIVKHAARLIQWLRAWLDNDPYANETEEEWADRQW